MNGNLQLYEAEALIALGQVAARRQIVTAARERQEQARSDIGGAALVGADPDFLSTWTVSLRLLGETGAAQPVLKQLARLGYQTPDFETLLQKTKQPYRTEPYRCCDAAAMRPAP